MIGINIIEVWMLKFVKVYYEFLRRKKFIFVDDNDMKKLEFLLDLKMGK